jgi:hypothetical protein
MTGQDFITLGKKIFIGIIIFLIPLLIFIAGLWLIKKVL